MENNSPGTLYLIPSQLGENEVRDNASQAVSNAVAKIDTFFVENIRTARRFVGQFATCNPIQELKFFEVNKHSTHQECESLIKEHILAGKNVGYLSEAGCPGIADPGALMALAAHSLQVPVKPIAGGSSITMALMASGLQGQQFTFLGYLPIGKEERITAIRKYGAESQQQGRSMICIETPYRNDELLKALIANLPPNFWLSLSCDLTEPTELNQAMPVTLWKSNEALPNLHKRPCVFCFGDVGKIKK